MNDVDGKLRKCIRRLYANALSCARGKGGDNECFRIGSGVRQGCVMYVWRFKMYMDAVMKGMEMGMDKMGARLSERRGENEDCLVYCMQTRKSF